MSNNVFIDGIAGNKMDNRQKESILKAQEKTLQEQLNILNKFIIQNHSVNGFAPNTLSLDEYKNMLLTGIVDPKLNKEGLIMIDPPRFFEARAMVDGNICFNKTEGIALPRFTGLPVDPQPQLGKAYRSSGGDVNREVGT